MLTAHSGDDITYPICFNLPKASRITCPTFAMSWTDKGQGLGPEPGLDLGPGLALEPGLGLRMRGECRLGCGSLGGGAMSTSNANVADASLTSSHAATTARWGQGEGGWEGRGRVEGG